MIASALTAPDRCLPAMPSNSARGEIALAGIRQHREDHRAGRRFFGDLAWPPRTWRPRRCRRRCLRSSRASARSRWPPRPSRAGCDGRLPSSARPARSPASSPGSCAAPNGLPDSSDAPAGSVATICVSGRARRIISPAPVSVPPVPQPVTKKSSRLPAKSLQDLRARGVAVIRGIRFVLELAREEPAVLLRELLGLAHHAGAALGGGRENHLRAEHAHDLAALDREASPPSSRRTDSPSPRTPSRARCRCCRRWPRPPSGPA